MKSITTLFKNKWKKQHLGHLSFELSKLDQAELNLALINVPSKILIDLLQFRGIVLEEKKYIHDKDIMTRKQAMKLAEDMLKRYELRNYNIIPFSHNVKNDMEALYWILKNQWVNEELIVHEFPMTQEERYKDQIIPFLKRWFGEKT